MVTFITVMNITGVARVAGSKYFAFYEVFRLAAIMYLILVYGFLFVARRVEKRLHAHLHEGAGARERAPVAVRR